MPRMLTNQVLAHSSPSYTKTNNTIRALFLGRGPFSKKLQGIFVMVAKLEGLEPEVVEVGRTGRGEVGLLDGIDLSFVVTPPQAHASLLPLLWNNSPSRPTWVEKPFGTNADVADSLLQAWERHGKPPTYVDFPHLRVPEMAEVREQYRSLTLSKSWVRAGAVVGGPGPDREYMNGLWDWGSHVAAFSRFLSLDFPQEVVKHRKHSSNRIWATGTNDGFHFMTGNGFSEKVVVYDVRYSVKDGEDTQPKVVSWNVTANELCVNGVGAPLAHQPLQLAMREMLAVVRANRVRENRGSSSTSPSLANLHLNWDPRFASKVTSDLDLLGTLHPYR